MLIFFFYRNNFYQFNRYIKCVLFYIIIFIYYINIDHLYKRKISVINNKHTVDINSTLAINQN